MSAHGTIEFIQTTKPTDNYLILDKRISEDDRLSLEARAILVYLLGKPPTWRVIVTNLLNMTSRARRKAGKHVVYAAISIARMYAEPSSRIVRQWLIPRRSRPKSEYHERNQPDVEHPQSRIE